MPVGFSQAQLLAVVRRVTPPGYHEPLEANANSGWEMHRAHALQLARVSVGLVTLDNDLLIGAASGPARAFGAVTFTRVAAIAAAAIKAGTELTTADGRRYATTEDAVFGPSDVGPVTVGAASLGVGYGYNCIAGAIDTIDVLATGSDEDTWTVTNASAVTLGKPDALQALGWDRGVPRFYGEADADYRIRITSIAKVVTPEAVEELLARAAARHGIDEPSLIEAWDNAVYCDDGYCDADPDLWAYSRVTHRGAFTVWLPDLGSVAETGSYCDFTALPYEDADYCDTSCCDGGDAAKAAAALGLLDALDRIKGAGIAVRVHQVGAPAGAPAWLDNFTGDIEAAA